MLWFAASRCLAKACTGSSYSLLRPQIPVYKESLEEVIIPTFASIEPAMAAYRRIGGQVKVIVCDDGLQV
jgi:hypothetical protein